MDVIATAVVNALVLSSMYILVALGFALMLSIMGIFNFAHGAIYMVGAFVTWTFAVQFGIPQWAALVLAVGVMCAFGLFLERFCFRPFKGQTQRIVIMCIALIQVLVTSVNVALGGYTRALPPFIQGVITTPFFSFSYERLITIIIGGAMLVGVYLFIRDSKTGKQMLAIAQNMEGAALQGISVNRTSAIASVMACGLASLAGSLMAALLSLSPYMGDVPLTKAIQCVILSGIGSVGGILWSGLIIGSIDGVLPIFTSASVADAIGLGIVILILLFRPKGLFGYELF
jgi:branched-chain amino acid transport system permease protein